MESSAVASAVGVVALAVWAAGTVALVVAGAVQGLLQPMSLVPDRKLLGHSGWQLLTNICAIVPVLTTAFSVQATAPFVVGTPLQSQPRDVLHDVQLHRAASPCCS